tara:strand:+ start:1503 stop:2066 length:564 start_codon:yes stop_codon:yes gene_type:complete
MSYKLYTDKKETFECKIHLEGASLAKATSRIIVETQDLKLMFEGTIDTEGNCKVPIRKLRGLLGEDDKGTMKLEVIAEDTYFEPWQSDFIIDTSKKIEVEVKKQDERQDERLVESSKPKMVVKEVKHSFNEVDSIVDTLHNKGIDVNKLYKSKKKMIPILKEYSDKVGYKKGIKNFIAEVVKKLSNK